MATGGSGSYLANLVKQKQQNVKASLALGITKPPVAASGIVPAPGAGATKFDPDMLDHVTKFLESIRGG
jgi:hypothetical protein